MSSDVSNKMREDWNARAREDAHYYVAFGRREQSEDEFLATAREVVAGVEWELKRLGKGNPRARRALEIGCGPGRLMKPLAHNFGEIHGVDVSDEMARLARERLRGIPHAHVHATNGAELAQFASASFDLVYSYAVFQHIPSRDVIFQYLRETRRVLKPGGMARLQLNGLPQTARVYDTWSGVRFSAQELTGFARELDFQILALEGASTQYMWTTWIKREPGWRDRAREIAGTAEGMRVRRITNAHNSEPVAPNRGRFASISIWVEGLPAEVDLFDLEILVAGLAARGTYIGPADESGVRQINAILAESGTTGLVPVELRWFGRPLCPPAILRVIPAGPHVPRILSVSDGINLLSGTRIETNSVKVTLEEVARIEDFRAAIDGRAVEGLDPFCTDPLPRRWEVNFTLPAELAGGPHLLEMQLGRRRFAPVTIQVGGTGFSL
jgi:SAM-dependent methyltransferase